MTKQKEQVSEKQDQTDSQTVEVMLDLNVTYVLGPDKKYRGDEIRTLLNQGILYRLKQSEFHKAQSEFAKSKEAYDKEIAQLRNEVELLENDRKVMEPKSQSSTDNSIEKAVSSSDNEATKPVILTDDTDKLIAWLKSEIEERDKQITNLTGTVDKLVGELCKKKVESRNET